MGNTFKVGIENNDDDKYTIYSIIVEKFSTVEKIIKSILDAELIDPKFSQPISWVMKDNDGQFEWENVESVAFQSFGTDSLADETRMELSVGSTLRDDRLLFKICLTHHRDDTDISS